MCVLVLISIFGFYTYNHMPNYLQYMSLYLCLTSISASLCISICLSHHFLTTPLHTEIKECTM